MTIGSVIIASTTSLPGKRRRATANAIAMPKSVASKVAQPATLRVSSRGTRTSWEVIKSDFPSPHRYIPIYITVKANHNTGRRQEINPPHGPNNVKGPAHEEMKSADMADRHWRWRCPAPES